MSSTTAIWWVRRDLRLHDNQALDFARSQFEQIIPTFILDPKLLASRWAGEARTAFLFGGLRALDAALRARGSSLVVRAGDPAEELARLAAESGAGLVAAERDHSPYATARDARVEGLLPVHWAEGVTARPLAAGLKEDGKPYTVYTPYSKKWLSHGPLRRAELLPAPERIATPTGLASLEIPAAPILPEGIPFVPGEEEARRRLAAFVGGGSDAPIYRYAAQRDRPDLDGTSQLSPYLRFGMVSARAAALAAYAALDVAPDEAARRSAGTWLNELIWRDFYVTILDRFPHVRRGAFRPAYDAIAWEDDERGFAAWCAGRTGYPIVDAAMRQLRATGWMHNRARMIAASFLVKDLLVDWRRGEEWFMQQLVDGDPAANNGGWQWSAGTGTDAAPYFRIFNPASQGWKLDPAGDYVRRWVPELARVPAAFIHAPWTMPRSDQVRAGCVMGKDYPLPIVDHAFARERVLAAYAAVKR